MSEGALCGNCATCRLTRPTELIVGHDGFLYLRAKVLNEMFCQFVETTFGKEARVFDGREHTHVRTCLLLHVFGCWMLSSQKRDPQSSIATTFSLTKCCQQNVGQKVANQQETAVRTRHFLYNLPSLFDNKLLSASESKSTINECANSRN